tara:strand:- start:1915 stop:2232 length:318 start_codon:yes stop_codon:yes gene_type:complete
MAKKQSELAGFERPSIEAIDDLAAAHLEACAEAKNAAEAAKDAKADVLMSMREHAEQLEKDSDGNHVYPYMDCDTEKVFVLCHNDALRVRNIKKTGSEEPEGDIG